MFFYGLEKCKCAPFMGVCVATYQKWMTLHEKMRTVPAAGWMTLGYRAMVPREQQPKTTSHNCSENVKMEVPAAGVYSFRRYKDGKCTKRVFNGCQVRYSTHTIHYTNMKMCSAVEFSLCPLRQMSLSCNKQKDTLARMTRAVLDLDSVSTRLNSNIILLQQIVLPHACAHGAIVDQLQL